MIAEFITLAVDAPVPNRIGEAQYLSAMIAVVLPLLVGLVTKYSTSSRVKSLLLLALSAVSSFFTEWLATVNANADFNWQQALFGTILTFAVAVGSYLGLLKPTGVSDAAQRSLRHD